jgi:hypothetical protein
MAVDKRPAAVIDRCNELDEATRQLRDAAQHGKTVAREITKATDPNSPDSFEHRMRQLLGRLN